MRIMPLKKSVRLAADRLLTAHSLTDHSHYFLPNFFINKSASVG